MGYTFANMNEAQDQIQVQCLLRHYLSQSLSSLASFQFNINDIHITYESKCDLSFSSNNWKLKVIWDCVLKWGNGGIVSYQVVDIDV